MDSNKPSVLSPKKFVTPFLLILYILFSTFHTQAQEPQDDDVVRVDTDVVVFNVTVVDESGKYVHGLKASDFKLLIDGREQTFGTFGAEVTPFAAAVLMDSSGSMERTLPLARSAAVRFLDQLRADDMAAVYRFDSQIEQIQDFSPSRDLPSLAYNIRAKGMTVLNDAIVRAAADLSQRSERRHAIIVLSDGADTHSNASANKALDLALATGATIYTVDMSATDGNASRDNQSAAALRNFSNKSGGRYVATPGGPVMREALASIAEELSNQYTLSYRLPPAARDGRWHTVEIQFARPNLNARTRKGFRAPKKS
jgi:Ca-activated chloride channel family protein